MLLMATGHHVVVGAADLDGDGRKELILAGINNRMGWYCAATAIAVPPGPDLGADVTPDDPTAITAFRHTLWYLLIPQGPLVHLDTARVDTARRMIQIPYADGHWEAIGFDGFRPSPGTHPSDTARHRFRDRAYASLREARHRVDAGAFESALNATDDAVAAARSAGDVLLAEWSERVRIRTLVHAGRSSEAEREAGQLIITATAPQDVLFDLATQLELRGEVAAAANTYVKGIELAKGYAHGRLKYEFLEGAVLTLGARGRWPEALVAVKNYLQVYPADTYAPVYRQYIEWRSLGKSGIRLDTKASPDFARYLDLEVRLADGESPQTLLASAEALDRSTDGHFAPLLALTAELLERMGQHDVAWVAAQAAMTAARSDLATDAETRALFDVVVTRFAKLARATENAKAAADTERELTSYRATLR